MPRYYFHFTDGKRTFSDGNGAELTGLAAARQHVTTQIRDIRGAQTERGVHDWSGWKAVVADAKGNTVFEVGFDLAPTSQK